VGAVLSWRAYAQLEASIEELREAGDPVSIADLKPEAIAPEDNAATYLARVSEDGAKLANEIEPLIYQGDFSWRSGLSPEKIELVAESFAAYPRVFPGFEQAASSAAYAWPFDYTAAPDAFVEQIIERAQDRRIAGRLHDCRAMYLAAIGKPDEAAMVYLQMLRITQLEQNDPLTISFLVRCAIEGITMQGLASLVQTAELKPETHRAIEEQIARYGKTENFVQTLRSERAFGIESFRAMPNPLGMRNRDWKNYLDLMKQLIAIGAKSKYEIGEPVELPDSGMAASILPAMDASRRAMHRSRATMRCLRILNAIHLKRIESDDIKLADLELPAEAIIDPYNGEPLRLKQTAHGWVVYAVGEDGVDNDGSISDFQTDIGVGPPESFE
jgi:hypothetical protein